MPPSKPNVKPLVWVTRPRGLEDDLIGGLKAAGCRVHYEPMLEIQPLLGAQGEKYPQQLAQLPEQDALIFISANAVDSFVELTTSSQQDALKTLDVYAVGKATAARLAAIGIQAFYPKSIMSSEGLLALKRLQSVEGKRFFIIRGRGGRGFLQQQLRSRGASAEHVEMYCRLAPKQLSAEAIQAIAERRFSAVFAGSIETFENILQLAPTLDRNTVIITPGERVSAFIRNAGFIQVIEAASASNVDMIETLQCTLAR